MSDTVTDAQDKLGKDTLGKDTLGKDTLGKDKLGKDTLSELCPAHERGRTPIQRRHVCPSRPFRLSYR